MLGVLAFHEFLAGLDDGVRDFIGDQAEFVVGQDGTHFHDAEGFDEFRMVAEQVAADVEVFDAAERLDAKEGLHGNVFVAEQVVFGTGLARSFEFVFDHIVFYMVGLTFS